MIKCKNGHSNFSLSLDTNECGCHHNGEPCIILTCRDCLEEAFKNNTEIPEDIQIPITKEILEELK